MTNKEKNFISIVVYIHNNNDNITIFMKNIVNIMNANFEKYEIICVNDCSTDFGVDKIQDIGSSTNGSISIVNMSFYQGIELSMNAGVDLAIGDFVYEFDSVLLDYDVNTILQVYYRSLEGYDIVSAAPENVIKKSSRLFYYMFNQYSNHQSNLRTERFRILSRRAINRVHAMSKTIPYRKALYSNCGLKTDTVLYFNTPMRKEKMSKRFQESRKEKAVDTMILFTNVAYRMTLLLASCMMITTIGTAIYTVITFFSDNKPVAGWTTTMLFLSFSFFGIFAVFAVIIKYLTLIVDLIFIKQKYTIESIQKISK